jgi:hypothetical protein
MILLHFLFAVGFVLVGGGMACATAHVLEGPESELVAAFISKLGLGLYAGPIGVAIGAILLLTAHYFYFPN